MISKISAQFTPGCV